MALKVREVDNLKKELMSEKEKAKDYLNRLMYLQADFDNYRKRVNKDHDEITRYGSQRLIVKLLPVVDELEYAVAVGRSQKEKKGFLDGIEMVLKKIYEILRSEGVSKIEAIGKSFDPSRHEAVEKVLKEKFKDGVVVDEIRKGYMFKERTIRPSLVKVAFTPNKKKLNEKSDEK